MNSRTATSKILLAITLFIGMMSLKANVSSNQQFEYSNLEERWLLLEDNLEAMYFHKNYVFSIQDRVWRPYTYQYNSISNSAELTIEGVSQTVSFSSSGQPISVFNVNEEYENLIPLKSLFQRVYLPYSNQRERYWRYKVGGVLLLSQ